MTRGPKPEPAEVKLAKGNSGHRPIVETSDVVPVLAHGAPDFLTGEALAIWQHLQPQVAHLRFVRATDALTLGRYCENFALWLDMRRQVKAEGAVLTTSSEHVKDFKRVHPALRAMLSIEEKLTAAEDRFGLSPASRQSLLNRMAAGGSNPLLPGNEPDAGKTIDHDPDSPLGLFQHATERPN